MKEINSFKSLKSELIENEKLWLLLFKKSSDQSDCALKNLSMLSNEFNDKAIYLADVNKVRDIHQKYGITSVPTLLCFEHGKLKNTIKGCQNQEQYKNIIEQNHVVAKESLTSETQKNVIVYTTPTCSWCTAVKRHFQENGIAYSEINVAADQNAATRMIQKSGQQGVPQTEINGQMVVGFDKTKINSLLGIN